MPMLSPVRSQTDTQTERDVLSNSLSDLQLAITAQESLYTNALPALPVPAELSDLTNAITTTGTELNTLNGAGYTPDGIRNCRNSVRQLCALVKRNERHMDPFRVEYRNDVVSLLEQITNHNDTLMTQALGTWVKRSTARVINTEPVQKVARNKGVSLGALSAGAILIASLNVDGCSSSDMPPTGKKETTAEKFHPRNKSEKKEGKEYNGGGEKFSVGGFLNASKDTFANGASPEAQAFQGVWNYIAKNTKDELKWKRGERFHFHTTPDKESTNLNSSTHFDINAYTITEGGKVIEITWQIDGTNESVKISNEKEERKDHTWRFTLNENGTIQLTNVFHDGRGELDKGTISKATFQGYLEQMVGF